MLFTNDIQRSSRNGWKKLFIGVNRIGRFVISCCWDLLVWTVFIVASIIIIILEGPSLLGYIVTGSIYILAVGWRSIRSGHPIRSYGMLACYLPAPFFVIAMLLTLMPERSGEVSDAFFLVELVALVALSRIPLLIQSYSHNITLCSTMKKIGFFIVLQGFYGMSFQVLAPSLFEPFEWPLGLSDLKPTHPYPSATPIQFFYEDREDADKIEVELSEVLEILKSSPFYQNAESLVLIQKPHMVNLEFVDRDFENTGGSFSPTKQYSYYFTEPNQKFEPDMIYYANNNRHRAVVIHELAHQLVSRFYGKWISLAFIPLWKNEGYAEYCVGIGSYAQKSELRAILYEHALSDKMVEDPFSQDKNITYDVDDYMAAFLQTRYALDVKKISPLAFMKRSYHAVSAKEIREWLEQDN